jgi:hypothetical protein
MAISMCYAIEQKENFNSNQSYTIEKSEKEGAKENDEAWLLKITFPQETKYWTVESLAKVVKGISKNIQIEIIWEKRQLVLDVDYYEEEVNASLESQLKGLQLSDPKEHEETEIGH